MAHRTVFCFLPLLLLAGAAGGAAPGETPTAPPRALLPSRLDRGLAPMTREVLDVESRLAELGNAVDLPLYSYSNPCEEPGRPGLYVQGGIDRQPLLALGRTLTANELMAALEVATEAVWCQSGPLLVLTEAPELAGLALLSNEGRDLTRAKTMGPLYVLSPQQAQRLDAGEALLPEHLTPVQQEALRAYMRYVHFRFGVDRNAVDRLDGVFIRRMFFPGEGDAEPYIGIRAPLRNGGTPPLLQIPRGRFRRGQDTTPQMPRGNPEGSRPLQFVTPPSGAPVDLEREPGLQRGIELRGVKSAYAALMEVHARGGPDLVAGPRLGFRNLPLPAGSKNALQPRRQTMRELMREVENCTGGTWQRVGGTLALRPNSLVERAAELEFRYVRKPRLPEVLTELTRRLRVEKALPGREQPFWGKALDRSYQEPLRWAVALAFAIEPGVAKEALELQGVTLRRVRLKKEIQAPGADPEALEYHVPTLGGGDRVIGSVPL